MLRIVISILRMGYGYQTGQYYNITSLFANQANKQFRKLLEGEGNLFSKRVPSINMDIKKEILDYISAPTHLPLGVGGPTEMRYYRYDERSIPLVEGVKARRREE